MEMGCKVFVGGMGVVRRADLRMPRGGGCRTH